VEGLVAALEPVFDERKDDTILLIGRMKECTNMALCAKL